MSTDDVLNRASFDAGFREGEVFALKQAVAHLAGTHMVACSIVSMLLDEKLQNTISATKEPGNAG